MMTLIIGRRIGNSLLLIEKERLLGARYSFGMVSRELFLILAGYSMVAVDGYVFCLAVRALWKYASGS